MPTQQIPTLPRKVLIFVAISLFVTIFGGAGVLFYTGFFTDAKVQKNTTPTYRIAYLSHTGPYNAIQPLIDKVAEHLKGANIEPGTPCALLLDDTGVPEGQRRAKVGYLVAHNDYIPAPLEVEELPPRKVLMATFDGGSLMGSYKSYEAMREWAKFHGVTLSLPAFEIYHPDGIMEYQLSYSGQGTESLPE